jgi:DeoR/GlpR family transcriptional regulator of sugar metabolism
MSQPAEQPGEPGQRRRRELIRRRVLDSGHVEIADLARELKVSVLTIHRDLDALQEEGWLRKIRGGATARPSQVHHGDVDHRLKSMTAEKESIARLAVGLIEPGQSVMLDDSTTALGVANALALGGRDDVTVITNFFPAMRVLAGQPDVELIALGGNYFPAYDAFLGIRTVEAVSSLQTDLLFLSTTAVTDLHCFHQSQETVAVKRALMAAAAKRVLLLDHSKFTKRGLHHLAEIREFDAVVLDSGTPANVRREVAELGVEVHVAEVLPG